MKLTKKISAFLLVLCIVICTFGGVDKTAQCNIAPNGQSFTVNVPFEILKAANKNDAIIVVYSAELNKAALIYSEGENTNVAKLYYSNNPNDIKSNDITPEKLVKVYTFAIDLTKKDKGTKFLSGAEFQLKDSKGAYIAVIKDSITGRYRVDGVNVGAADNSIIISDVKGKIYVDGLKAGEYKLTETKAPDGYNKLMEDFTVTIVAQYDEADKLTAVSGNTPLVINSSSSLLPGTGGIGTTIFIVSGISFMAIAVILLIIKKSKASNNTIL